MKTSTVNKRKTAYLRWQTPFWPDWTTGYGKGELVKFGRGTELEMTEKGTRGKHRWRVIGTHYQAFLEQDELEPS